MSEKAMLDIQHYSKSYSGDRKAADDVSLRVDSGDIYGFIGHNGAGKSTTIRAVVGVLDFTEGEIYIDGHSVKDEPMACKQVTALCRMAGKRPRTVCSTARPSSSSLR